jgi:hypothetical protein
MRCRRDLGRFQTKSAVGLKITRVFVIVAVKAQQFPVAAIGRIVVVIVVTMVHCKLRHIGMREFAHAAPTHPRIHFQRALAIAQLALVGCAPCVSHNFVQPRGVRFFPNGHAYFPSLAVTLDASAHSRSGRPLAPRCAPKLAFFEQDEMLFLVSDTDFTIPCSTSITCFKE